eukprot:scaffold12262_cov121-Isochrysis_galbana.AAC.8
MPPPRRPTMGIPLAIDRRHWPEAIHSRPWQQHAVWQKARPSTVRARPALHPATTGAGRARWPDSQMRATERGGTGRRGAPHSAKPLR